MAIKWSSAWTFVDKYYSPTSQSYKDNWDRTFRGGPELTEVKVTDISRFELGDIVDMDVGDKLHFYPVAVRQGREGHWVVRKIEPERNVISFEFIPDTKGDH